MKFYLILFGFLYSGFYSMVVCADEVLASTNIQRAIDSGNYQRAFAYANDVRWSEISSDTQLEAIHAYELMGYYQRADKYIRLLKQDKTTMNKPIFLARIEYRMASIYRREGHYKEGLEHAIRAVEIMRKLGTVGNEYRARFAGMVAILHAYLGHNLEAWTWFGNAFRYLQEYHAKPLQSLILKNDKAIWFYRMGRFQDVIKLESKAIEQGESSLSAQYPELAEAYNNIAAAFMAVGQSKEAALWYQKSIHVRQEKLGMQHPDLATSMNNFAVLLLNQGDDNQAEKLLRTALKIRTSRLGVSHPFTLSSMNNLSQLLQKRGVLKEAKSLAESSLGYAIKQFGSHHVEVANAYTALGDLMVKTNDYTAAANNYKKALDIQKDQQHEIEAAWLIQKLGYIHQLEGEMDVAARAYEDTIHRLESLLGMQHPKLATVWNALGSVRYEQGKHGEAVLAMQRALSIQRPLLGDLHPQTAATHNNIARVYTDMGKKDLAIEHLELAANALRHFARSDRQAVVYANLASLYADYQRNKQAVEYFELAMDAVEALFADSDGLTEEERSGMMGKYSWIYQGMMELLLKLHRASPDAGYDKQLLQVASRNQSRIFSELMLKTNALHAMRNPDLQKALARESEAKLHWQNLRYALAASVNHNASNIQSHKVLVKQVKAAGRKYKLAVRMVNTSFPHVMDLRSPRAVSVGQIQGDLRQGDAVMVYALLEKETLLFVITQKSFHLFPLPVGRIKISAMVHQLRRSVSGEHGLQNLQRLKPKLLYKAYQTLLKPAEPLLKNNKLLYIVGDGSLYTLPFEMLIRDFTPAMKEHFEQQRQQSKSRGGIMFQEYADLDYVPWSIIYMPSLSSLHVLKTRKKKNRYGKNLTAFANPVFFEGVSQREQKTYVQDRPLLRSLLRKPDSNMMGLKRLLNTEHEAKAIADILGGKHELFFGSRARESTLYATDLSDSRFILFATHGLLSADFSLPGAEPSLALSMDRALRKGEDGLLSMSEVLNLNIDSELVALSACNTSGDVERAQNGEGFAGLTRAFMYAGARRLLVSHWSVETYSTEHLMQDFFADMADHHSSSFALKQAREKLRASFVDIEGLHVSGAHPFFWAPFVLVGVQ